VVKNRCGSGAGGIISALLLSHRPSARCATAAGGKAAATAPVTRLAMGTRAYINESAPVGHQRL